jgi:hypothetical protein
MYNNKMTNGSPMTEARYVIIDRFLKRHVKNKTEKLNSTNVLVLQFKTNKLETIIDPIMPWFTCDIKHAQGIYRLVNIFITKIISKHVPIIFFMIFCGIKLVTCDDIILFCLCEHFINSAHQNTFNCNNVTISNITFHHYERLRHIVAKFCNS